METFSHILWDEWVSLKSVPPVEDEITGMLDGLPRLERDAEYVFQSGRLFMIRRLMKLWPRALTNKNNSTQPEEIRLMSARQNGRVSFAINKEVFCNIFTKHANSIKKTRNWNWVRGLWGSCGALYIPKSGYHLVLRPQEDNGSTERILGILKSAGFAVGLRKKDCCRELMLRDQQQIVTFLSRLGFVQSIFALEDTSIMRSMRSHANQLVNCDSANINKSLETARKQTALINQLEETGIINELPGPLLELIDARKKNPSISLNELGQSLSVPISKSTVEYRWKKIENTINTILKGDGTNVLRKSRR